MYTFKKSRLDLSEKYPKVLNLVIDQGKVKLPHKNTFFHIRDLFSREFAIR